LEEVLAAVISDMSYVGGRRQLAGSNFQLRELAESSGSVLMNFPAFNPI
jgi:hypothetical protein